MSEYFCTNFAHLFVTTLCTNVLLCAVFTWHVKLTETQTSKTNFTTEQKVDFIIKVTEQQVPPLLWRRYFYIYVQHSIVINYSIFKKIIIAVRPITLVMGKISYEDKARVDTLRKLGFGCRKIVAKFPEKGWQLCSVTAICKRVDERGSATERKPGSAVGRKKHKQRKMLDTLSCWLAKIEHWLWCCATSLNY